MKTEACPAPQDNVLDLTDLELCPKCKAALLAKFMEMVRETEIDKPWYQEDLERIKSERN